MCAHAGALKPLGRGIGVTRGEPLSQQGVEFVDLEYMDWKSGVDTNFAPIATSDGELDCRGFWKPGDERPDKGGKLTANATGCPRIVDEVTRVSSSCGFSVPEMRYERDRDLLTRFWERKSPAETVEYWAKKNLTSIDGLPAVPDRRTPVVAEPTAGRSG